MDILLPDPKILAQTDIVACRAQLLLSDALMVTVREQRVHETGTLTSTSPGAKQHGGAIRHF
jgi:hypothetical protein